MTISTKTRQMLWGRAAGRCAFPDCRITLVVDASETDDETLIGEACHMVAESVDGPRGESDLSAEQRDKYANLVLLCRNHHRLVDTQPETYTIEGLQLLKNNHETWVELSLPGYDKRKQRDDEIYAGYVDEWASRVNLANWHAWTSHVLAHGQPWLSREQDRQLGECRTWLLSRIWPRRYPELEDAFQNFRLVLNDFHEAFHEHAEPVTGDPQSDLMTRRFYKIDRWDEKLYHELLDEFNEHVALVCDLMLELTRAANLLCDQVRRYLQPSYRLKEGHLLVEFGPTVDFSFVTLRVEYRSAEREKGLYGGLKSFKISRKDRDFNFGSSVEEKEPRDDNLPEYPTLKH